MPSDSEQRGRASPPRRPTRKKSLKENKKIHRKIFNNMSQKERTYPSFPILNTTVNTTVDGRNPAPLGMYKTL